MQFFKLAGGAAAAIAVMGMSVPAQAQSRDDRRGGEHRGDRDNRGGDHRGSRDHHRGNDKVDAGGLLLGALIIGGIAALSSSEKKRREKAEIYEADYDISTPGVGSPVPEMPAPYSAEYDGLYDMDAAADRCAIEAETLGQIYARLSRVSSVSSTTWSFGKWLVDGKVELAESYNDAKRVVKFHCRLKAGQAPQVSFKGL